MKNLFKEYCSSPIGIIEICATEKAVSSLSFFEEVPEEDFLPNKITNECAKQLDEYFSGSRKTFDVPVEQEGTTFRKKVWKQLSEIPFGKTISYLQLAKKLGDVKAIRAAGTANAKNNVGIIVPCHRVIGSDGKLIGYASGLWRKDWLLKHEAKQTKGSQVAFEF